MYEPTFQTSGKKTLLSQRETVLIIFSVLVCLIISSILFSLLWRFFRIGLVWLLAFLIIVYTRKTDSWKMGLECFYFLTFMLTYALGPLFAASVIFPAFYIVIKIRPDELQGSLTQYFSLSGVMLTTRYFAGLFGPSISPATFLILGTGMFAFWDFMRFLIANKITGQHWVKLFVSYITGVIVNYFYFSTFAYALLQFLLSV